MTVRRACLLLVALAMVGVACAPAAPAPPPPPADWQQNGSLGSCPVFPADNAWNTDISGAATLSNSQQIVDQVLADDTGNQFLHADFGGGGAYGIPYVTVPGTEPKVPINYTLYGDESDPGPFPIPLGAPIEQGSDAHVIAVDRDNCQLYELWDSSPTGTSWNAGSGATWNLRSDALRPAGWTSADAAGLPIFPGLVRYDEVSAGAIHHALRFTVRTTQDGYVSPARHCVVVEHEPERAGHGDAVPAQGVLPAHRVHRRVARRPPGPEDLRDDRRRQRDELVHHRRGRLPLERQRPRPAEDGARLGVRGGEHRTGHVVLTCEPGRRAPSPAGPGRPRAGLGLVLPAGPVSSSLSRGACASASAGV